MSEQYQILRTKDFALAVTLASAGIPFASNERWCVNTYPAHILAKAGMTADEMIAAGKAGELYFCFQQTPDVDRIVEDFNLLFKGKGFTLDLPHVSTRDIARIVMTGLKNRGVIASSWQKHEPHVRIEHGGGNHTTITKHTPPEFLAQSGIQPNQ